MSDTLLVQSDPITRTSLFYHHDYVTGKEMLVESQDVEPIIERNKRLQNQDRPTISKTKELRLVAAIPGSIHYALKKRGIIRPMAEDPWQRRLMKWLDAHPKFKTLARRLA